METLRSLRPVITRIRKPGSARRAPAATAVRVVATSGVLISALALAGAGAAEAATGSSHAVSGSHASAHSKKAGHSAKAHADAANRREATKSPTVRPGPWIYDIFVAKGPFLW